MKQIISIFLFLSFLLLGCSGGKNGMVRTYIYSSDLYQRSLSSKNIFPKGYMIGDTYYTTPTKISGQLYYLVFMNFLYDQNDLEPGYDWQLRENTGELVYFDLTDVYKVSESIQTPSTTGDDVFNIIRMGFLYVDLEFEFDSIPWCVRVIMATNDGYYMSDLLMKDEDGIFKWISKSGDPNELLSERPEDPVLDGSLGWPPEYPNGRPGDIWDSSAIIPEEYLVDVPSIDAQYEVTLDFEMEDTIVLIDIFPNNYTKRDILEQLDTRPWSCGPGIEGAIGSLLVVYPTVVEIQ